VSSISGSGQYPQAYVMYDKAPDKPRKFEAPLTTLGQRILAYVVASEIFFIAMVALARMLLWLK